jgi:hypothetical protein
MRNLIICAPKFLIFALFFQVFAGCLTMPGRLIPIVPKIEDKSANRNKPKVFIDVNFHSFLEGKYKVPVENIAAKDIFLTYVKEVTEESKIFDTYTFNRFQTKDINYTIQLDMLNYGNYLKSTLSGLVSGLSLTLIPITVKDNYRLTAKILDSKGNETKTYIYDDYSRTWIELLLFPFVGSTKKVGKEVLENMVRKFYTDILNESDFPIFLNDPTSK